MGEDVGDVALWPSAENYARFKAVCDDEAPDTFEDFEALASRRLEHLAAQGVHIRKVSFDPEAMALWCRTNFGKVDADTRKLYAGVIATSD